MSARAAFLLSLLLASPLAASAASPARPTIAVKGSDTIGGELGPALARAYEQSNPGVTVRWEGLGSATAFPGLFDGSADLGAASRSVNAKELAEAKELGVELKEYVLGYDGIAVIVHKANGVRELTLEQVAALFTGKVQRWSELGGADLPVKLLSRPAYSGTHGFFKEHVLRKGNKQGKEEFATSATIVEHSEALLGAVAREPGAVGYVGMGYLRPEVLALAVSAGQGRPFVSPSIDAVRTGAYPIYRPLMLYTRGEPQGELRRFLSFVLAGGGRKLIASHDFIPADVPNAIQRATVAEGAAPVAAARRVYRVQFPFSRAVVGADGQRALVEVAGLVKRDGARLRLIGNSDARGKPEENRRVAEARVSAVAARLAELGVPREALTLEVRGAESPLATNDTARGRRENRRVDVEVLPRR